MPRDEQILLPGHDLLSEIHEALLAPFPPEKIRWRVGQAFAAKSKEYSKGDTCQGRVLAYIDVRDRDERLDEAVGPFNWNEEVEIVTGGFLAHLSIVLPGGIKVTRTDGAPATDIESFKGGISDAKKRAGVAFGIARYLYDLGETEASLVCQYVGARGPVWVIPDSELNRLQGILGGNTGHPKQESSTGFLESQRDAVIQELKKSKKQAEIAKIVGGVVEELGSKWDSLDDLGKMRYILLLEAKIA